jgi:hypothetical protein
MLGNNARYFWVVFLGIAAHVAGCSASASVGTYFPVEGQVTLGKRPLVGGTVSLLPLDREGDVPHSEGTIDVQGHYKILTAGKQGAPLGRYRAIVTTSGEDKTQDSQFNSVYSHSENSPLTLEVLENAPAGYYDLKLHPLPRR